MKAGEQLKGLPEELGYKVRDLVSGIEGTAYSLYEYITGTIQIAIEAKIKADGTKPESWVFDARQLVVIDDGLANLRVKPVHQPIALGSAVKCKLTGFRGIAYMRLTHLNGCVEYNIVPKFKGSDETNQPRVMAWQVLEVVDQKFTSLLQEALAKVPNPKKAVVRVKDPPGGPARRVIRRAY